MNKANIISLFGKKSGTKLIQWLDPCCNHFCIDVAACGVGSPSLPFNSVQYNNNGAFFGDVDFTRSPTTQDTLISKVNGVVRTGFTIDNNIAGLPFSGSGLVWDNSTTSVTGLVLVGDGTGLGTFPGTTTLATINNSSNGSAVVGTGWDTNYNTPKVFINTALGTQDSGLVSDSASVQLLSRDTAIGQGSQVQVNSSNTSLSYKASTAALEYKAILGDGVFSVEDTLSNRILYLDIANRESILGNVAANSGIRVYVNDATGINIQTPGGVVNVGANGFGDGTNIQIDDINQLVTITNVPTYADDAAAGVGGLTTGQLYKTTTGGSTFLKIVP